MTDRLWQEYLAAVNDLTGLETEVQRRYAAADAEHQRAGSRLGEQQQAVEKQWKQVSEQAARVRATGDELLRRFRLTPGEPSPVDAQNARAALAEAESTITWCTQASRWVSSYQERTRQAAAAPAPPRPAAPVPTPPAPPASKKSGCAPAAAVLVAVVGSAATLVLKLVGAI